MLSDRFIRNAKPGMYADEGGLYLQVYPTGRKAFIIRDQSNGKQTKRVIGAYPAMSLAAARERVNEIKTGRVKVTVQQAFMEYYEVVERRYTQPERIKRIFDKDILPTIKDRELASVTRAEWMAIFKQPLKRNAPAMANATLTNTKTFLSYCEDMGWIEHNPIERAKRENIGGPPKARDRNLTLDEIVGFLDWLRSDQHDISTGIRVALYLCLLTGLRASEVLSLKLTSEKFMTGDAKRTRRGPVLYKVPVTPEIKAAMRMFHDRPSSHICMSQVLLRHGFSFTPHDLRRTFVSRLNDLGVAPHVVEKLVNHKMGGMLAVYNHAEYWPERVAAMRLWCQTIRRLRKRKPPHCGG